MSLFEGNYWVPTFRNPFAIMESFSGKGLTRDCIRGSWNHRLEIGQKVLKVSCSELRNDYFFVSRECGDIYCIERLMQGSECVKEILFHNFER